VKAVLEASIVASPDAPGLSETQLVMVSEEFGLEEGELLDAAMIGCTDEVEYVASRSAPGSTVTRTRTSSNSTTIVRPSLRGHAIPTISASDPRVAGDSANPW
jgi:hypothetical protein